MALAAWWRGDPVPALATLPHFRVEASRDEPLLARLNRLTRREVCRRRRTGHQPYLAWLRQTPVGYGWVATQELSIGELGLRVELPAADRYLWDFATLPEWQGYGVHPRLLQGILGQLAPEVERVWIIHAPENTPSGAGMRKAGLQPVGQLSFRGDGGVGLTPLDALERAQAGAALLGIPLIEGTLSPCWHCGGATDKQRAAVATDRCWPPLRPRTQPCTCTLEHRPAKAFPA
jgi:GNAT superfamily N-acetyltransferase